jgi:Origin recognition complex (ORC) subunit 5 C-terminus
LDSFFALQMEQAREARLQGLRGFTLERLLAIFWMLVDSEQASEGTNDGEFGRIIIEQQSGEVFMQINSLVSLHLLSKARSLPVLFLRMLYPCVLWARHVMPLVCVSFA